MVRVLKFGHTPKVINIGTTAQREKSLTNNNNDNDDDDNNDDKVDVQFPHILVWKLHTQARNCIPKPAKLWAEQKGSCVRSFKLIYAKLKR